MIAARAFFIVTAGLIPEEPQREFERQWGYTSQDYAADALVSPDAPTEFATRRDQAIEYARELMDPRAVNWVRLEFVWL